MAQLLVLYKTPKDAAAFDKYYFSRHAPLAKAIPGLRKYEVSEGTVMTPGGPSDVHLIATLHFDNMNDVELALASPQGQAAAGDLPNFASGGVELLVFDNRAI